MLHVNSTSPIMYCSLYESQVLYCTLLVFICHCCPSHQALRMSWHTSNTLHTNCVGLTPIEKLNMATQSCLSQNTPPQRVAVHASCTTLCSLWRMSRDAISRLLYWLHRTFRRIARDILRRRSGICSTNRLHTWHNIDGETVDASLRNDGDHHVRVDALRHEDGVIVPLAVILPPHGGSVRIRFALRSRHSRVTWILD